MRLRGVRGIHDVSSSPGLAGYSAPMKAGAFLGYVALGYRRAELGSGSCGAQRSLPARLEGQATRGHGDC